MMASGAPTTPTVKRSFSLPPQMSKPASSPDSQIETLYNLPSARIIQFNAGTAASTNISSRPGSSNGNAPASELPGTLSWVSRFERTIAVGALRIYRAPGSVAFLNCQSALRPILPKSQAWCVDGDSKFVLQIRPPQYWRIEVPNGSPEEKEMVDELKKVLDQVLRFEKTICPFQRDFTVELPEASQTPIKRRPWRPTARLGDDSSEDGHSRASSVSPTPSEALPTDLELLQLSECDNPRPSIETPDVPRMISELETLNLAQPEINSPLGQELPSTGVETMHQDIAPSHDMLIHDEGSLAGTNVGATTTSANIAIDHDESVPGKYLQPLLFGRLEAENRFATYMDSEEDNDNDSFSDATDDTGLTPRPHIQTFFQSLTTGPELEKPQALQNCTRSVTAPPVLSLVTSPPSKHRTKSASPLRYSTNVESNSDFSSSVESFHSVQSWHSPLAPPSPPVSEPSSPNDTYPYPHENISLPKRPLHLRDASQQTVVPITPRHWDISPQEASASSRSISPVLDESEPVKNDGEKHDEEPTEAITPPVTRPPIRHRATTSSNSRRRALSPLPAAVNLFSPPRTRSRKLQTARHLPTAIIQKTCEILLSPPSHLFHLMISIASKIAAGEWRGMLSNHGEAVHWDFEDDYGSGPWFEDDYNMAGPSKPNNNARSSSSNLPGGSWEVD